MQDRPTAAELLEALSSFMRDRADYARDRWERFQFQVAANSIQIIKREVEMEDGFMRGVARTEPPSRRRRYTCGRDAAGGSPK